MKIRDLNDETMLFELRRSVDEVLSESIIEYLSMINAQLKSKKREELFSGDKPLINLDQLASIVAGVKVLGNKTYRQAMTKDDIGINPNSSHQLLDLLDSIPKDGKGVPKLTDQVFYALKHVAPGVFKTEAEKLKLLSTKDDGARNRAISDFSAFVTKVSQLFNKVKTISSGDETQSAKMA